ncbi:hypothetical protein F750_0964 [Streptomyces sp. PAMC 26508]|nr:hypothetical protein F750_0964 [Streptomyces sp. PAMC 26508]
MSVMDRHPSTAEYDPPGDLRAGTAVGARHPPPCPPRRVGPA